MNRLHQVIAVLVSSVALVAIASAQAPPTPDRPPVPSEQPSARPTPTTTATAHMAANPASRPMRRSIVHHYPYPYTGFYVNDATGGFRNPGGTSRYLEYYPPGNQFQIEGHGPVKVATFGGGGIPDRAEQFAAQQVGIRRYNALQRHIDSYAWPYFGYGLGVGYFGGFY